MDALSTSSATSAAKTNSIGVTSAPAFKKLATVATSITNLKKNDWGFHSISVRSNNGRRKALSVKVSAASKQLVGSLTKTEGFRFAVVIARFNEFITKPLLEGAMDGFRRHSVREEDVDVIWVPGSFEIPLTAQTVAKSGKYNAVLCIGAVIRGATTHYEAVANSAASGIVSSSLNSGVPCIFGVLTCDTMEQAIDRAGGKAGNKGYEAALTAIEMASLLEHHLKC